MLNSCVSDGRPIVFIHAAIDSQHHAFKDHVEALARQHDNLRSFVIYEKPLPGDAPDATGFLNQDMLASVLPESRNANIYFLGPKPFMVCVNQLCDALAIPESQRHHEFFGPAEELVTPAV